MSDRNLALEWENRVVLSAVQALLGFLTPVLRGVAVEVDGMSVRVYFALAATDAETREDIDDVIGDIEGLLWPAETDVRSRVSVGSAGPGWEGRQHRMVLLAKDPTLVAEQA